MFKKSGLPLLTDPDLIRESSGPNAGIDMNPGVAL
jgi:hypothetical protein